MIEPLTFKQRWRWVVLVWKTYHVVANRSVAKFSPVYVRWYRRLCARMTLALLLNNEVVPLDINAASRDLRLAYDNEAVIWTCYGSERTWDYVQLYGWCSFICGSDGEHIQ